MEQSALDRFLGYFFPKYALRRFRAQRLYEAAKASDQRTKPRASHSADNVVQHERGSVRQWARYLDENHDLVVGILDTLINKIVATGFSLQPSVKTRGNKQVEAVNKKIKRAFEDWAKRPTAARDMGFGETCRLACRAWLRDGELLSEHLRGRIGGMEHATAVPYSIRLIEADYLPYDLFRPLADGIVHGVEKDQWGKPVAYHLYVTHPGENFLIGGAPSMETVRIPASQLIHLKFIRRIGQTRGVSILHAVITRLDDLKDYEESERIAARVAAAFVAYIKKGDEFLESAQIDAATDPSDRSFEIEPGTVWHNLLPGEDVGTINVNRPNTALMDFRASQMKAVASGTGTNSSSISRNYSGTYSAQRQEMVESVGGYDALREIFVENFVRPIYQEFLRMAITAGEINIPRQVDPKTVYDVEVRGPGQPWIDPLKETQADVLSMRAALKSRHQIIRDRGGDPAVVDEQIENDPYRDLIGKTDDESNGDAEETGAPEEGSDPDTGRAAMELVRS